MPAIAAATLRVTIAPVMTVGVNAGDLEAAT